MGRGQQKQWNQSQIDKSNAGLAAAKGYGTQASGENPASQFQTIADNPMSPEERAGRLSATGSAYDALGEKAGERTAATRNSAGYGALLDELSRGKARDVGTVNSQLDTEAFNRKMAALQGKGQIYGTDVNAQTNLLRPESPNFQPGPWASLLNSVIGGAGAVGAAYAGK